MGDGAGLTATALPQTTALTQPTPTPTPTRLRRTEPATPYTLLPIVFPSYGSYRCIPTRDETRTLGSYCFHDQILFHGKITPNFKLCICFFIYFGKNINQEQTSSLRLLHYNFIDCYLNWRHNYLFIRILNFVKAIVLITTNLSPIIIISNFLRNCNYN